MPTFPVFAVTFKGKREEARIIMVSGPGRNLRAQRIELFWRRGWARQLFRLVHTFNQQRQGLVPGTRLDHIHALDGAQVIGIGRQSIECVRRHAQHFAGANLICGVADKVMVPGSRC